MEVQGDHRTLLRPLTVLQGGGCLTKEEQGAPLTTLPPPRGGTLKTQRIAIRPPITRMTVRGGTIFLEISTLSNSRHYFRGKEVED